MRLTMLAAAALVLVLSLAAVRSADAAGVTAPHDVVGMRQATQPVDQHDGSRVEVQLVVAGIAAGLVVGVGTLAYLVRRKLGLTAYSPDQAGQAGGQAGGHH